MGYKVFRLFTLQPTKYNPNKNNGLQENTMIYMISMEMLEFDHNDHTSKLLIPLHRKFRSLGGYDRAPTQGRS